VRALLFLLVPAVASAQPAFDPIGDDGWPSGVTTDEVRGLPECGAGELSHEPGALLTCRPRISVHGPQWAVGLDWTSGGVLADMPTMGAAHALGVDVDFTFARRFVLGVRYELMDIGMAETATSYAFTATSNQFFGMLKYRLWNDEVARRAWTLGAGVGYALRGDALGGSSPVLRGSLARELGRYVGRATAVNMIGELSFERSTGAMPISAVLATARFRIEGGIHEPHGLDRAEPREWPHTTGFGWLVGPALGFDVGIGLRASRLLSLETDGGYLFGSDKDLKQHGYDGASWWLISGPRLQLGWPNQIPLFVEAQAGGAWVTATSGGELRPIAQTKIGFYNLLGCSAVDLGFWLRGNLDGAHDVTAGGFELRLVLGSSRTALGAAPRSCGITGGPRLATPYVPPPPPVATTRHEIKYDVAAPAIPTLPSVDITANVQVEVRPVVIDISLGASIGGFTVNIDPRVLPIPQLRGAGFVQVELSGPPGALPSFQAQLSGTLSRQGARVDAWSTIDTGSSVVHAKFTIWPPGTRPAP
jgi:hypothetical protein